MFLQSSHVMNTIRLTDISVSLHRNVDINRSFTSDGKRQQKSF